MPYPTSVPMLTNIPATGEEAVAAGQPTYFVSDRPETEAFLEMFPERPYKRVLRDVRERRPTTEELSFSEAWKDFKTQNLQTLFGGQDPDMINPTIESQNAKNRYLQRVFGSLPATQIRAMDPGQITAHYKEADRQAKAELEKSKWNRENALRIKQQFYNDWKGLMAERKGREAKKGMSPIEVQTAYPELTGEEAASAARAWNIGDTAAYNKIVMGKKRPLAKPEIQKFEVGEEVITKERDPLTGEWKEIARAPRVVKNFKDKMIEKDWNNLTREQQLEIMGAMKSGEILNEATILRLSEELDPLTRQPRLSEQLRNQLRPTVEKIISKIEKRYEVEPKILDERTAREILKEAGGNKEKARKIAKERGYKF